MGRIHAVKRIEDTPKVGQIPRVRRNEDIAKAGRLGDLIVKNGTERARRQSTVNLGAYWLRSNGARVDNSNLDNPNLPHDLKIRSGAGFTQTTQTPANPYGKCQVYCQNGSIGTEATEDVYNNLAGASHTYRVLTGACTISVDGNNIGELTISEFQDLCTAYANAHPAPTQPPTTQPPPTTATTEAPTTEPIEPSSTVVPMETSSSVVDSLAYFSSQIPTEVYQKIVSTTQAYLSSQTSSPVVSSTTGFASTSANQGPAATPAAIALATDPTGVTVVSGAGGGGVDGAAIGFSFLGVGAAAAILVSGIVGTTKVIKSYLSYREAKELKEPELPVRYTNIPNS